MTFHQDPSPSSDIELTDQLVSAYLQAAPDFFMRNARQVEQMLIPHPVKGSVSLVEWQLARQRQQIDNLEQEITLLMEQANANQRLFSQLLSLQSHLASAQDLDILQQRLRQWAKELGLADAAFRLFSDSWQLSVPCGFNHLSLTREQFMPLRIRRFGHQAHFLGRLSSDELSSLLPNAKAAGSVALSLLMLNGQEVGILLFNSRNQYHYQPGMGTELLSCISEFLPTLLTRWLVPK